MTKFKTDIIVFDDHEFRGSAVQAMIESAQMVNTCNLHSCVLEADLKPGSVPVKIVNTSGQSGLGIYVAGGRTLMHPGVISSLTSIFAQFPDIAVVALRDDCSTDDLACALHLGLQGIIPSYLPKKVAMAAIECVLAGGHYFPYSCVDSQDSAGLLGQKVIEPFVSRSDFDLTLCSRCWLEALAEDDPATDTRP